MSQRFDPGRRPPVIDPDEGLATVLIGTVMCILVLVVVVNGGPTWLFWTVAAGVALFLVWAVVHLGHSRWFK